MYPIIYQWSLFGQERVVAGYGLSITIAMLFGLGTAVFLAWRRGLDPIDFILLGMVALGAGLLGSYLLFVLTILSEVIKNPSVLLTGGLVFYGGPLVASPAVWLVARRLKMPVLKVADITAPSLSLAHALGRMGCFLGGCCYGKPWDGPWAVTFTHPIAPASIDGLSRHPVQLYESAVLLTIALSTHLLWRRSRHDGQVALAYVAAYGLWRFFVEMLRGDDLRGFLIPGLLSTSQTVSVLVVPAAIAGLVWLGRRGSRLRA